MFKLVRRAPLSSTSQVVARPFSTGSLIDQIIRKLNKTFRGSETPHVFKDKVLQEMMQAEKWRIPSKQIAKEVYLRDRARANYVKHNVRIRKLEDKVTGGVVGIQSFQNRF